jgi:hypothetical protein
MINDLRFALALNESRNICDFVVTEKVFMEIVDEISNDGHGGRVRLNIRQESLANRFAHEASWRGIRFIHTSRHLISDTAC